MTQCEMIVKYMQDFGSITAMEAIKDLGVMRLASRITDLRKSGYSIKKDVVTGKNRYGKTIYYVRYSLDETA